MARAKTILPARPSTEPTFVPPTEQERAMFVEKLVECCVDEVDGHQHKLVRLVYAVKNISVTEERREQLHRHLWVFENEDDLLIRESEATQVQIDAEMNKPIPPKTKAALVAALPDTATPKAVFVQRYMDNKVVKIDATFAEFKELYAKEEMLPKEL